MTIVEDILLDRFGRRFLCVDHQGNRFFRSLPKMGIEEYRQACQMIAVAMGNEEVLHTQLKTQIKVKPDRSRIKAELIIDQV